ncbi:MAG: hypothetical protein D8M52_07065 [Chlorobi bacterium]|nr:MAG: hypothetical protein F9K28_06320 [Bacteroidota bacterium]MBL1161463.1 hypothetical protein [Chlorobiota bacterium]MBZ0195695.1 hypothetical protein [Candidatus Kapabacteria bacterium]
MTFKMIVGLMVVTLCQSSVSQELGKFYPLRSKDVGRGAVYALVDESVCFTASKSIQALARAAEQSNVPFIVFVLGASENRARNRLARDFPNVKEYVIDEFYVYDKVFDVRELPALLILDKYGKLLFSDAPGKSTFDLESYLNNLKTVDLQPYVAYQFGLTGVQTSLPTTEIHLPDSISSRTSLATSIRYNPKDQSTVLLSHESKLMYQILNNGMVRKLPNLEDYNLPFVSSTPIVFGLRNASNEILLWDTDMATAKPHVVVLNPSDTSFYERTLPSEWNRIYRRNEYDDSNDVLIIPKRIDDGKTPYVEDRSLLFVSSKGKWSEVGVRNEKYYAPTLCNFSWTSVSCCWPTLYVAQNFSNRVNILDAVSKDTSSFTITIPDTVLAQLNVASQRLTDLANAQSANESLGYKLLLNTIAVDESHGIVAVSLVFRASQLVGASQPYSKEDFQSLVVYIDKQTRTQYATIQYPINFSPFQLSDGMLRGTYSNAGKLSILAFVVPRPATSK